MSHDNDNLNHGQPDPQELFDKDLTDVRAGKIEELLQSGEVSVEDLAEDIRVHAALAWRAKGMAVLGPEELLAASAVAEPAQQDSVPTATHRSTARPAVNWMNSWRWTAFTSAASIALVLTVQWLWSSGYSMQSQSIARVVDSVGLEWQGPDGSKVGDRLVKGPYDLVSGIVEVEFNAGARVVIEAPAEFELENDHLKLTRGNVVGKVPVQACGFTVETPTTTVIDLGTEFGVGTKLGETFVEVFEGEVILDRSRQIGFSQEDRPRLLTGEAARIQLDVAGIERVEAGQVFFTRNVRNAVPKHRFTITNEYVAAVRKSNPLAYWRFETIEDGGYPNEMSQKLPLVDGGRLPIVLAKQAPGNRVADFVGGTWLKTLENVTPFDETSFSIEVWVCPREFRLQELVWLDPQMPGGVDFDVAALSLLQGEEWQGPTRRVRFSHSHPNAKRSQRSVYSVTPYSINEWQHLVGVKKGPEQLLYVNGELVAREEAVAESNAPFCMVVGRLPPPRENTDRRYFSGQLDELAIYDHALSTEEIKLHYQLAAFPPLLTAQVAYPQAVLHQ